MAHNVVLINDDVQKAYLETMQNRAFKLNLQTDLFSAIAFPSLPYNFQMLMADINFPAKAKNNPNGSLFMRPMEIDSNSADDIGLQCFGDINFGSPDLYGFKMTYNQEAYNESLDFANLMTRMLFEDTTDMHGIDIDTEDIKSRNAKMSKMMTDVVNAITTYVSRSVTIISPIVQMVSGSSGISGFKKAIETANKTSFNNVKEWLEDKSEVFRSIKDTGYRTELNDMKSEIDAKKNANIVFKCIAISSIPGDKGAYLNKVSNYIENIKNNDTLNRFINTFTNFQNWTTFYSFLSKDNMSMKPKSISNLKTIEEALKFDKSNILNEDEAIDKKLSEYEQMDYDTIYHDMFTFLSSEISEVIGPRADWSCIKELSNAMKFIKDRADEEIKNKIAQVCKTGGQKSLRHHPFKAEGLLSMWNRYSADLQMRIDNRIAQLTGSQGSVESGSASFVEDFLRVTYPRIIAMMLTYRCIFKQLSYEYKNGYIPYYTVDDFNTGYKYFVDDIDSALGRVVSMYDVIYNNSGSSGMTV